MITIQVRGGETVRIEVERAEPDDIRERDRTRELFSAARAVVAAGQDWHRLGDPQSAERLSLAIGRLEAAIGERVTP